MSEKSKINIIWFRDQEPARRLRLRTGWIRVFTYLLVFLVLLSAGGMWGAWELWRRTQDVQLAKRDVDKRLSETLLKLERLQNIEKLLQTSDPTELSQLLAGLGIEGKSAVQAAAQPASQGGKGKEQPKNGSPAAQPAPEREKPAGFDLADIMGRVDLGQVSVENFRGRIDPKAAVFSFDLSNLMPQPQAGGGQLLAITREGGAFPLQTGKDELTFNIQRFKQVAAQAALPQGVEPGQVFGFRLVLTNASGKTIFSETYPLAQTQ